MEFETTDKSWIAYSTYGDPTNPPLVIIHGNSGSQKNFQRHVKDYISDYWVITYDDRGHGKSSNTQATITYKELTADLVELCDHLSITAWNIVGYSDGANVALKFAYLFPNKTISLVLTAPNLNFLGIIFPIRMLALLLIWLLNLFRWLPGLKRRINQVNIIFETPQLTWQDLEKIKQPALIIVGQYDFISSSHTQMIANHLTNSKLLVLPNRSHLVIFTAPHYFTKLTKQFLNQENRIHD